MYAFSIIFCCLCSFFLLSNQVEAAFSYVCVDSFKEDNMQESTCDDTTDYQEQAYAKLISIESSDVEGVTTLTIPDTYSYSYDGTTFYDLPVKVIGDGNTPLIAYDENYELETLVLPSKLAIINHASLQGFNSIKSIAIPKSVEYIGTNVFYSDAAIENIYFLAYMFGTNIDDYISIEETAFPEGVVINVICEDHSVYDYYNKQFANKLNYQYLLTKVTYNYYASESETSAFASSQYYVGDGVMIKENDLESFSLVVPGLSFTGWSVKNGSNYYGLHVDSPFYFVVLDEEYNVYPNFDLNPLTNIKVVYLDPTDNVTEKVVSNNSLRFTFDGLIRTLQVKFDQPGINSEQVITWSKDSLSLEPDIYGVYDSGKYTYSIKSTYMYNNKTYESFQSDTIEVTVLQREVIIMAANISQIYGDGLLANNCSYTSQNLLPNHVVGNTNCYFHESESSKKLLDNTPIIKNVGEYINSIEVEVTDIINSSTQVNEKDNYHLVYQNGKYSVSHRQIVVAYENNVYVEYGDPIVIENIHQDSTTGESIGINYVKSAGLNVGEYSIVAAQSQNSNYYVVLDSTKTGKVYITPKPIEVQMEINSTVYDGMAKKMYLYYIDVVTQLQKNLEYTLYKDEQQVDEIINAGRYIAKVVELNDDNYSILNHSNLTDENPYEHSILIDKAVPNISKVDYQSVTYSGKQLMPHVIVNNTEQIATYTCMDGNVADSDGCIKAGVYQVAINVAESDNYRALYAGNVNLTINPRMIHITPKTYTFYYDDEIVIEEKMSITNEANEVEELIISYTSGAEKGSAPGSYSIISAVARFSYNRIENLNYRVSMYTQECANKVKIVKRPVKVVYFDYTDLVYNGQVRQIGARVVDDSQNKVIDDVDLTVVCDEGEIKNAQTYHLRAYLNDPRYYISNSNLLEFNISKAKYDLSGIEFVGKKGVLNFKSYSISINGTLPEGVRVVYTIDGKEGNSTSKAFNHEVVATFHGDSINYMPIDSMKAYIYIDMSWIFITASMLILVIGIAICGALLYVKYRREHPKKIKLKIRNIVKEDLEAKRVATSVEELLGDEEVKTELLEDDNDLLDESAISNNFIDRIYAADSELKYYYSEVKNELLSYAGVAHTVDRKYEVFYHGTRQIAKLSICNNILRLYVNLPPEKYDKNQYKHKDMSKFECHARTPLRIEVNTMESLRNAKVFIRILRKKENLKTQTNFVRIDYEKFYTLKENIFPKLFKKMFSSNKAKHKSKK